MYNAIMKIIEFKGNEVVQNPSVKRYEIGSQTKMFTALLILIAYDKKLLDIDEKVSKYLDKKFLTFNHKKSNKTYDVSNNTIKELVSHNIKAPDLINFGGGITDIEIFDMLSNADFDITTDQGILHIIENFNQSSEEEINNLAYNNTGFWLLGKIIAHVFNCDYETAIKKYILSPLEMNETNWNNSDVKGSAGGRVYRFPTKFYGPAGGLVSSYQDMNKFMNGFHSLIKPETFTFWKELSLSRPLGSGLVNLTKAVKEKYTLKDDWWGHSGQTLQMQSASFINDKNEVLLITTDDALFNPFAKVLEKLIK